jgi:hypothetical protein
MSDIEGLFKRGDLVPISGQIASWYNTGGDWFLVIEVEQVWTDVSSFCTVVDGKGRIWRTLLLPHCSYRMSLP